MKKLLMILLMLTVTFSLFACADQKTYDDSINVYFFTANNGATQVDPYLHLDSGMLIDEPEEPTRVGYEFDQWYKDYLKSDPWDFDVDRLGETSITLYAGWIAAEFNIIYDPNGGTMPTSSYPTTFTVGQSSVLPTPTRSGFSFRGWYSYDWEDESSTIPGDAPYVILPSNKPNDVYLYAHWESAIVSLFFKVNYPI